ATVEQSPDVLLPEEGGEPLGALRGPQRRHRARPNEVPPHRQAKERAQRGQLPSDGHGVVPSMKRGKVGAAKQDVKLVEGGRPTERLPGVGDELVEIVQIRSNGVLRGPLLRGQELAKGGEGRLHVVAIVAQPRSRCESRVPENRVTSSDRVRARR